MFIDNRKHYLLLPLIFVILLLSGLFVWKQLINRSLDDPVNDEQMWHDLSNRTLAWLEQGNYKEIQKVEHYALESTPSPEAARYYAKFALNCAKSRRMGKYGDTYVMLAAAEEGLGAAAKALDAAPLIYDLADEFSLIHCYHRAFKLIEAIPEPQRGERVLALRRRLTRLFSLRRTTTRNLPASENNSAEEQLLSEQLIDMLGTVPQNGFYTEQSLMEESSGEAEHEPDFADPLIDPNAPKQGFEAPLMAAIFRTDDRLPPLPESLDEYEEDDIDEGTEEGDTESTAQLESIALSSTEKRFALELLAQSKSSGSDMTSIVKSSPLLSRLLMRGVADSTGEHFVINDLARVIPLNDSLTLIFSHKVESRIYCLAKTTTDSIQVYVLETAYPGVQVRDISGDRIPDLILRDRQGSGSYLNIDVIDPSINKIIFQAHDLANGEARFVDLDNDDAMEILALTKTSLSRTGCTQCPARYEATLFDYDVKSQSYRAVGRKLSYGELNMLAQDNNSMGIGSHIYLDLFSRETYTDAIRVTRQLLQSLKRQPTGKWSKELLSELGGRFATLDDVEESSMGHSTDKLDLQAELVETLNRPDLPLEWLNLRRTGQLWRISSLFLMEEYEEALGLSLEPWLMDGTESKEFRGNVYNTRGILYQQLGRMHLAYDAFMRAINELKDLPLATSEINKVNGNLAFYFRTLGDFQSSYSFAREALDQSILARNENSEEDAITAEGGADGAEYNEELAEEDTTEDTISESAALDMNHLAEASFLLGKHSQALDWAGRALPVGRSSTHSAISPMSLEVAARIALLHNKPVLTLQLLDEAILTINENTWRTGGGGVLLLYGKAIALQGDRTKAIEFLKASAKLSKDINTSVYVTSLFELSQIMQQYGSPAEALKYAHEAFEGISLGRRSLKLEDQKFSFLADKRVIASWYFRLRIEAREDPAELLNAVESWKMRTFIDLYDDAHGQVSVPLTAPELTRQLSDILGDDDLLLNGFVA